MVKELGTHHIRGVSAGNSDSATTLPHVPTPEGNTIPMWGTFPGRFGCSSRTGSDAGRNALWDSVATGMMHYRELTKDQPSLADILNGPPGIGDVELELPERTYDTRAVVSD